MTCLIYTDDETAYREEIRRFSCEQNFPQLNVSKTREMIFHFNQTTVPPSPIFRNEAEIERVSE